MKKIVTGLFIAAVLAGCGPAKNTSSTSGSANSERDQVNYTYVYHNGLKEKVAGNFENAAALFAQCIKIDNSNPAAFYELASIYNYIGKKDYALNFSKQAAEKDPNNKWYLLLHAEVLRENNLSGEAVKVYEKLVKAYPSDVQYQYNLANLLTDAGDLQEAIRWYDKIEQQYGISEVLTLQKQKLYLKQNKFNDAEQEVKKLISAFPKEPRYYGLLADLYQANNMFDKAAEQYHKILELDPENPFAFLSLADKYKREGDMQKSFSYLARAYKNPALDIDTKVKILLSFYVASEDDEEVKKQAYELCDLITSVHPDEAKGYSVQGDYLYRDNRLKEAREAYRKAVSLEKDKFALWSQLLVINSRLDDMQSLEKESEQAIEVFPAQPALYMFGGIAKNRMKKHKEAVELLEEGVAMATGQKELLSQMYSTLGDAYHSLGDHQSSDEYYEKAIQIDPANSNLLNNYSYYLSVRKFQLQRAEELAKKANQLDPGVPSYQDTYAWVLFRQGKYAEALEWLEKALSAGGGSNAVIMEHCGDVYFNLGNREKAIECWKKAKELGEASEMLERKIKEQKFLE